MVVISALWLGLFSYKYMEYSDSLWWQFAFTVHATRFLRAPAGAAAVLLRYAVGRLMRSAVHRPANSTAVEMTTLSQIVKNSTSTIANLALSGNKFFRFNLKHDAFIMFAVQSFPPL
jgi:phosphatidylglycerol lysyltransferase